MILNSWALWVNAVCESSCTVEGSLCGPNLKVYLGCACSSFLMFNYLAGLLITHSVERENFSSVWVSVCVCLCSLQGWGQISAFTKSCQTRVETENSTIRVHWISFSYALWKYIQYTVCNAILFMNSIVSSSSYNSVKSVQYVCCAVIMHACYMCMQCVLGLLR